MAGNPAHGEHLGPVEARQDGQLAVRVLQRRGMGKLGEYLGHLERNYSAGCGSDAQSVDDGAGARALSGKRELGAAISDGALWRLCQPLANGSADGVDDREPGRL